MWGNARNSKDVYSYRPVYESRFTGTAHMPANINGGVPFRVELKERHYINSYAGDNINTRYEWKLILPPGYSVSGTGNPMYGTNASSYTQNGDTIIIKSTNNQLKDAGINLVLTCGFGGNITFPYSLVKIDNDVLGCRRQGRLICSSVSSAAFCPGPCPDGPSNYVPVVRRADGSLGWTDNTMSTRQVASAISAFDLSKALFLDTIEITGRARQNSTIDNLFLEVSLSQASTIKKLDPLDASVKIIRGGISYDYYVASSRDSSSGTTQRVNWDFTLGASSLPTGTMLPGDSIITVTNCNMCDTITVFIPHL